MGGGPILSLLYIFLPYDFDILIFNPPHHQLSKWSILNRGQASATCRYMSLHIYTSCHIYFIYILLFISATIHTNSNQNKFVIGLFTVPFSDHQLELLLSVDTEWKCKNDILFTEGKTCYKEEIYKEEILSLQQVADVCHI